MKVIKKILRWIEIAILIIIGIICLLCFLFFYFLIWCINLGYKKLFKKDKDFIPLDNWLYKFFKEDFEDFILDEDSEQEE